MKSGIIPWIMKLWDGTNTAKVETLSAESHDIDGLNGLVTASQIYARIDDDTVKPVLLDALSHGIVVTEFDHHNIHAGVAFTCHYNNDCTNTGEMTIIALKTPNTTKWIHMVFEASASADAYMAIYEASDLDVDEGSDLTIYNRNRNSATTSVVSTIETVPEAGKATSFDETQAGGATLSTATELFRWYMGAATTGGDLSGEARGTAEFILMANTQYAFVVVSTSNDDNTHNLVLTWYEHTSKN